jgi:hypothetical protein
MTHSHGAMSARRASKSLFLGTPRSDAPTSLLLGAAPLPVPIDATRAAPDDYMSEMALDSRRATGGLPGAATSATGPSSQDEVHRFLRSQIQLFLDYRAGSGRKGGDRGAKGTRRRAARR